jgi:hypothetical protein
LARAKVRSGAEIDTIGDVEDTAAVWVPLARKRITDPGLSPRIVCADKTTEV